jgi:hypothetical protein
MEGNNVVAVMDRVVFIHMWSFLDYHSQVALKRSCHKYYEWGTALEMSDPDFSDFHFDNLFKMAPLLLSQCKPSAYIDDTLVWVYRNGDTVLQVYFRMIRMGAQLFPALWHIKLDYLYYSEPGSRYCVRGYRVKDAEIFIHDDTNVHPANLVCYIKYEKQIVELDYKKIWPGCNHGGLQPESACIHGKCPSCRCTACIGDKYIGGLINKPRRDLVRADVEI